MEQIIKGFIIGIGKIIPGVSGAMFAITLGIYEDLIESISNIRRNPIKSSKYLIKPCIGIIMAIIITSKIIVKCLDTYYLATMLLFVGMIIGGIPKITSKTKFKIKDIIIILTIIIIISQILKQAPIIENHEFKYTYEEFLKLIGIGILDSISSIVPGISGTAILMMMGYYDIVMNTFSNTLNINNIAETAFVLTPFIIGFIIGILITAKIINKLIKYHSKKINMIITIFMIQSLITIIKTILSKPFTTIELIIGIVLLIIGIKITIKLDKNE